jgi:hypothetical protein
MAVVTSVGVSVLGLLVLMTLSACASEPQPASQPSPTSQPAVEALFWEDQIWKPGGGGERLTLWSDGRSEITVKRFGDPRTPKPGWTVRTAHPFTYYTKANPLPADEARQKFHAALAAGIEQLKPFESDYHDGGGTLVGVQRGGKMNTVTIPEFTAPEKPDNAGSENHKRYIAVQKILDGFDTDAVEK